MYRGGWEAKKQGVAEEKSAKVSESWLGCRPNHGGQGEDPIEKGSGQISPEPIEISPEHTWSYLKQDLKKI